MFGFIKDIFTNNKEVVETGTTLVKRAADGIDMMFYTDEEKEQARKAWWTDVFIPLEKALAPQGAIRSVSRRIIANDFCKVYLFMILANFVVWKVDPQWAAYGFELVKVLTYPVSAIILFYFGSYGVGEYLKKKNGGNE